MHCGVEGRGGRSSDTEEDDEEEDKGSEEDGGGKSRQRMTERSDPMTAILAEK